uniref:Uncharacterized protein n=1 Tax=Cyclopterus lumpus TaxID=8103 RepID=A0A8C3AQK0_CYCLU
TDLPGYYQEWLNLANNLTHLRVTETTGSGSQGENEQCLLHTHSCKSFLRLAHLALGFISMGYVWQEGQHAPAQILPKALALPYWLVSCRLGLPPILTYADSVLDNLKLKDPTGNMDLIFLFPGRESCRGFFMVSLLVEMAASSGITVSTGCCCSSSLSWYLFLNFRLMLCAHLIHSFVVSQPHALCHVDLTAFHGTLRIFVSGGLLYEGVSNEPISLSGASAAQSSAIQCFDALLCIQHENEAGGFLTRMRDYMPPAHRQQIETLSVCPSLRDFIVSNSSSDLCQNYHLNTVTKYIIVPGNRARTMGCPLRGVGTELNGTGTSGSSFMVFLKSVRNATQKALILE